MGQRVTVQYSVDIEELEAEMKRLLSKTQARIDKLSNTSVFPSKDTVLSLKAVDLIDETRAELAQIDYCLKDIMKIINGYVSYKSSAALQQEFSQEQAPPPTAAEDLEVPIEQSNVVSENMQEAIEKFRNQISAP